MRLWIRYLREKRITMAVYFLTVFFFIAVGSLYHIENLEKMLYAGLLSLAPWGLAFLLQGLNYVHKSRELEKSLRHLRESGDLILERDPMQAFRMEENEIESVKSYEELQEELLLTLSDRRTRDRQRNAGIITSCGSTRSKPPFWRYGFCWTKTAQGERRTSRCGRSCSRSNSTRRWL